MHLFIYFSVIWKAELQTEGETHRKLFIHWFTLQKPSMAGAVSIWTQEDLSHPVLLSHEAMRELDENWISWDMKQCAMGWQSHRQKLSLQAAEENWSKTKNHWNDGFDVTHFHNVSSLRRIPLVPLAGILQSNDKSRQHPTLSLRSTQVKTQECFKGRGGVFTLL